MDQSTSSFDYLTLTADIVSAYVGNNSVQISDLPRVISEVHAALAKLSSEPAQLEEPKVLTPPVSIRKSVTADHIISLEDGKPYKSLKRHLTTRGLTPEQYREKWGLPRDYPMVAPNYAKQRSELAKTIGLGQIRRKSSGDGGKAATPAPSKARRRKKAA